MFWHKWFPTKEIKRIHLLRQLLTQQYEATMNAHASDWIYNLRANGPHATRSVLTLSGSKEQTRCYIVVGGASNTQNEEKIRKLRNPQSYVIGVPTALPWMMRHGLEPHLVVYVDKHKLGYELIRRSGYRGPVALPSWGNTLAAANCDSFWFNLLVGMPGYMPLVDSVTLCQYPDLPSLPSAGDVTGASLQVALLLAEAKRTAFLSYTLVGADYGYWNGLGRVPRYGREDDSLPDSAIMVDGQCTHMQMVMAAERMLTVWHGNPARLSLCADGLLGGPGRKSFIPYVSIDDAIAGRFPPAPSPEYTAAAHERYMLETLAKHVIPIALEQSKEP